MKSRILIDALVLTGFTVLTSIYGPAMDALKYTLGTMQLSADTTVALEYTSRINNAVDVGYAIMLILILTDLIYTLWRTKK